MLSPALLPAYASTHNTPLHSSAGPRCDATMRAKTRMTHTPRDLGLLTSHTDASRFVRGTMSVT